MGRVGKFHALVADRRHVFKGHASAPKQVGGAGENLHSRYTASQRSRKSGVLWPHAVFCPHLCGDRCGRLVAVTVSGDPGGGVDAKMRVHIDEAGCNPLTTGIDFDGTEGDLPFADPLDLALGNVEVCLVKAAAITSEYGGVFEQHRLPRRRRVGRGKRLWLGSCSHGYQQAEQNTDEIAHVWGPQQTRGRYSHRSDLPITRWNRLTSGFRTGAKSEKRCLKDVLLTCRSSLKMR